MKNRARNPRLRGTRVNPLKLDPTRTTLLRRAAIADVRRRFARLRLAIDTLVVKEDSFGLARRREGPRSPFAWNAFCPTGAGGGVDPSCGASDGGGAFVRVMAKERGGSAKSEVKVAVDQPASMISAMIFASRGKNKGWGKGLLHEGKVYAWPESDSESSHHGSVAEALGLPASKYGREGYKKLYFRQGIDEPLEVRAEHRADAEFVKSKLKNVVVANVGKFTTNERWELRSSPEQLAAFQEWLRKQLKWYVVGMTEDMLWARYVQEGFKKGAGRAFDDLRSKRGPTFRSDDFAQGQRQQFLATSFRRPETVKKVKILASRTFEELTNVGEEIRLKLGRVLTDGLARGDNPRVVAREMTRQLAIPQRRAETIARTEIIRAHAEGQLSAMEDLGVDEVGVMVEWSTAGDDRVCESCSVMEGVVLKLEEAHGMIPRHPSCRCSFVPANVGESRKEQVRGKTKIERQIDLSARLAGDTFDVGIEIDKNRPRALVSPTKNAFCPTGPGGGQDNSCSSREDGRDQSSSDLSYDPKYSLPKEGGYVRAKRGNVEYHVNPSKVELGKLLTSSHGHVRGLADGERVVVWDANKALHKELSDAIGGTGVSAFKLERAAGMEDGTLFLTHHPISISDTRGDHWKRDWPDHHPYFKRLGSKTEDDDTASYMKLNVFVLHAFCPTGPGGGVDPTCSPSAGEGGGPTSAPLRYKDHKGTNHEHNAEIVKTSKVKVIAPEKYKKDVTEALAHVLESKFLSKQMEGVTVEVTSLGNRHGNMSKHLYVSQESLEQHGPGFMATIVRHELEHKILTSQGVPSSKQESRVRHTAGTWAAIKYGSMATTNPRAAEGFKKAAIEQGVKVL